jgi:predicted acetyltransferase
MPLIDNVSIRKAVPADAAALITLIKGLADYEKLDPPDDAACQRLITDGFGDNPKFETYLSYVDNVPVGYAIVYETYSTFLAKPTLFLEDIFVMDEYRNRRIGYRMYKYLMALAKERDCGRFEFVVLDWNKTALDFYSQLYAKPQREWLVHRVSQEDFNKVLTDAD